LPEAPLWFLVAELLRGAVRGPLLVPQSR